MSLKDKKYTVLVIGSGAREHAIADAVSKSPFLNKLYLAGRNDIDNYDVINYNDYKDLAQKAHRLNIDIVIIGPEKPICDGLADIFENRGISCIAPSKDFSRLESSKLFAKKFMAEHGIKCAKLLKIEDNTFPQVIKADGLCAGKGVKVVYNEKDKKDFTKKLAGQPYFIEEYLNGPELSVMSLFDGKNLLTFAPSRDFKLLNADVNSPNTGGMGAYCPVCLSDEQNHKLYIYLEKLKNALIKEKANFTGFIYSGLVWAEKHGVSGWYVLEYNVRLGDPETQAILTHLKTDFLSILISAKNKSLNEVELVYHKDFSACLTVACKGYPENPVIGSEIGLPCETDVKVFYAGVRKENNKIYSNGGRVLSLCINSPNPFPILKSFAQKIKMENKYFREDIDINN